MKLIGITGIIISLEDYFKNVVDSFVPECTEWSDVRREFIDYVDSDSDFVAVSDSGDEISELSEADEKQYHDSLNSAISNLFERLEKNFYKSLDESISNFEYGVELKDSIHSSDAVVQLGNNPGRWGSLLKRSQKKWDICSTIVYTLPNGLCKNYYIDSVGCCVVSTPFYYGDDINRPVFGDRIDVDKMPRRLP